MSLSTRRQSALPDGVRKLLTERIEDHLELPFQSSTSAQVMSLCNDEKCDAFKLGELISFDQSLAGHVLAVANSAAYAPKEPIISLHQAVSRLGIGTICEISMAVSLKGKVFDVPGHATLVRELWMHSACSAAYCKEVARSLRENVEGAFLSGLLHDVGMPIVLQNLVDMSRERTDRQIPHGILTAAMEEFHEAVGARMVHHWQLPAWIAEVVAHHHAFSDAGEHRRETAITRMGDLLAHWALDDSAEAEDFAGDADVERELNLYREDVEGLLDLRGQVLEVAEAFL